MSSSLSLPVCQDCGAVQYPPREICGNCLSPDLETRPVSGTGRVLSSILLHHSLEAELKPLLPLRIATVALDAGGIMFTYCHRDCAAPGSPVDVSGIPAPFADPVYIALPENHSVKSWAEVISSLGDSNERP